MLMKVQPLTNAIDAARRKVGGEAPVVYLSPQGRTLKQSDLQRLAALPGLVLVAGRYEGIDERVIHSHVDEELSVGDYVLSGGELPAMLVIDGVIRLLPGALGDPESIQSESFSEIDGVKLLDYPQYTRPESLNKDVVPSVLLSGDHEKIRLWRLKESLRRTWQRRPDLLAGVNLNEEMLALLEEVRSEDHSQLDFEEK